MNCNMSELYCYTVKIDGKTIYVDRDDAKSQEEAEIIARNSKPFDLEAYLKQHKKQNWYGGCNTMRKFIKKHLFSVIGQGKGIRIGSRNFGIQFFKPNNEFFIRIIWNGNAIAHF